MTLGYLLDTSTVSYIINGRSHATRVRFREAVERDPESVSISSITEAELRYGLQKRPGSHASRTAVVVRGKRAAHGFHSGEAGHILHAGGDNAVDMVMTEQVRTRAGVLAGSLPATTSRVCK